VDKGVAQSNKTTHQEAKGKRALKAHNLRQLHYMYAYMQQLKLAINAIDCTGQTDRTCCSSPKLPACRVPSKRDSNPRL